MEIEGYGHRITMTRWEIERLLLELTDLPTWAQGLKQLLRRGPAGWQPWPHFPDEHLIWD
ncbi:hypothetical protein J7E99_35245 [Streptomyces sp. ISL-44]|uniref:hypothetical protein n=1 Tax=Streptomyces sp. ISL-44 TaxID=2819184 RepID=UPI001BE6898B|nr:hypothetical protein [Streptomyces sp. ISL-44]MBT2545792.1 hypothetical protein [Streptomyces sp. ISL-44]